MSLDDRIHWALTHGIGMGIPFGHAPFTVKPFPFPRSQFEKAKELAPLFNLLVEKIARNPQWLIETLKPTAVSDNFIHRLIEIYEHVLKEGIHQPLSLAINRSDYMLHFKENDPRSLLQVELNTISSSFGSLSTKIAEMHHEFNSMETTNVNYVDNESFSDIPINTALDCIAEGLACAHKTYIAQTCRKIDSAVVAIRREKFR